LKLTSAVRFLCWSLAKIEYPTGMRIALIINLLQWMIFDFLVKAYPMFALDIIIIIVTLINFLRFRNCDEEIDFKQKNKVEDIAETK
jgi:hypothetical protein